MTTVTAPRHRKSRIRFFWNLRYRMYALIVVFIVSPILFYAADMNIPENVAVEGLGYKITDKNILASRIERVNLGLENVIPDPITSQPIPDKIIYSQGEITIYDKNGKIITEELRSAGIDLGFISSLPFQDIGSPVITTDKQEEEIKEKIQTGKVIPEPENIPLNNLIPAPENSPSNRRSILNYDKYKIKAPIIYTAFEDLFEKREDGTFNFSKPIDTSDINSPVQKKLEQGIVHLAYTPQPGEVGNSYIIGHSSNYSFIQSPYNRVFAPIQEKSQAGEEFIIYDRYGRELKFKVFETLKIAAEDVSEAYKNYEDKRVVTLQTSILGYKDGKLQATHRWLTRGELVIE